LTTHENGHPSSGVDFEILARPEQVESLVPEWQALFDRAAVSNPFAHPAWLTTWARHYASAHELYVVTMRSAGSLVGVAPFYRHVRPTRRPLARSLRLLGASPRDSLTEMVQVLVEPGRHRQLLRALVAHLSTDRSGDWDWIELALPPEQGWIERNWLPRTGPDYHGMITPKATRAFVVMPLDKTWPELRSRLKRNVKESIRRGYNRLDRAQSTWELVVPQNRESVEAALRQLALLHRARGAMPGKERHRDALEDPSALPFLLEAGPRMFDAGHLVPVVLQVDGRPVAARLLLRSNGTLFFSASGFEPAAWEYGVATTLMAECLKWAVERGDTAANLSSGPEVSKLRWSEQLSLHQDFLLTGDSRRSRGAFALYWLARSARYARYACSRSPRDAQAEAGEL
jgi:CelD/BcsL family acetyltransferase involved in cellulose biosynthesis